jgi:hypothetical protein
MKPIQKPQGNTREDKNASFEVKNMSRVYKTQATTVLDVIYG